MTQHFDLLMPGAKKSSDTLSVLSPYDCQIIARVATADEETVDLALNNAQSLFNDRSRWLKTEQRLAILQKPQN